MEVSQLEHALRKIEHTRRPGRSDRELPIVVSHIQQLASMWCRNIMASRDMCCGASPLPVLVPFGSYRLGVEDDNSDLDLLVLAPRLVQRDDFFSSFIEVLKRDVYISDVQAIPSAHTPVIKLVYEDGIVSLPVDLVFANTTNETKLHAHHCQKNKQLQQYILDDADLDGLDEGGVRSLNGARVSQLILESVPDLSKYRTVLKAVKHWATERGIYSNTLGFLGGVSWAILTAYVCQANPAGSTVDLLRAFFTVFSTWDWRYPVMLNGTVTHSVVPAGLNNRTLQAMAWNPRKNPRDGLQLMKIITPTYPCMNSSYNVQKAQLRRIQDELCRTAMSFRYQRQNHIPVYAPIVSTTNFFASHTNFVRITIAADTGEDFSFWFRWVETRLRVLIGSLETDQIQAFPFSRFFDESPENLACERTFYIALRFSASIPNIKKANEVKALQMEFLHQLDQWDCRKSGMTIDITLTSNVPEQKATSPVSNLLLEKDDQSVSCASTAPSTEDEDESLSRTTEEI